MKPHKSEEKTPQEPQIGGKELFEARIEEVSKKLRGQEEKAAEFRDAAQRVQAEFENFVKRSEREKEEFKRFADAKLIEKLLPVLDSFDEGIAAVHRHEGMPKKDFLHGLELLRKQFFGVLEKSGLREIESVGKKFDPNFHECMLKEHIAAKDDEIVLEQFQKGYLLQGKVLRTRKVKVNRLEHEEENQTGKGE